MTHSPFAMLLSGDLLVSNPDGFAHKLVERLGVVSRTTWRQEPPGHSYIAHFLRVNRSLAVSPTRIEVIGYLDRDHDGADSRFSHSVNMLQGPKRPMRTHSTVVITSDVPAMAERLLKRGLPFRSAEASDSLPNDRLWVGSTPERPEYEPSVDGGLFIEFMGITPLQMPSATFDSPPPGPEDTAPGSLVRLIGRGFIVRNIAEVIDKLEKNFGWEAAPVEEFEREGYRRCRMAFSLDNSATLDLLEPTRWDSQVGRYLGTWGPGPFYIRMSVVGLASKAEELSRKGVQYSIEEDHEPVGGQLLRVAEEEFNGALFELVEHEG